MDSRICDHCGNSFKPSTTWQRYCSKKCGLSFINSIKKSTDGHNWWTPIDGIPPRKCPICSKIFYSNIRKCCSDFCSYTSIKSYKAGFARRKMGVQGFMTQRCPECKSLFTTNDSKRKFCSEKCLRRFHAKKYRRTHPFQIVKKQEVCKHIYDTRNDPDSISNLIEDLTGISCDRKIRDEKEDHRTESPGRGPWEMSNTTTGKERGCVICGLVRDRKGIYCSDCWRGIGKRYDPHAFRALGKVDVTVEQKRKCLSCRILPICIKSGNVHDGCDTIFKSLQDREAKKKIRSLTEVVIAKNKEDY